MIGGVNLHLDQLADACLSMGCEIQKSAPMSEYTSFRIGGPADLLITVPAIQKIQSVKPICEKNEIPLLLLGNGTNMLVGDNGKSFAGLQGITGFLALNSLMESPARSAARSI